MSLEFLTESVESTLRIGLVILPLLFIFDLLSHRYGEKIENTIKKSKNFMPLLGAFFGLLPGCNVAVITAVFYTEGVATLGTLIATLIATSDEALYVFLPLEFNFFPLLVAKLVLAILAGYLIDFVYIKKIKTKKKIKEVDFCCAQHPHNHSLKKMFGHALRHTIKIVLIVFVVLASLNFVQDHIAKKAMEQIFASTGYFQPLLLALVGLIPGCGTSVGIATFYTAGVITFGAAVAGLSTASGEALVVMASSGVKRRAIIEIALILFILSSLYGLLLQSFNF